VSSGSEPGAEDAAGRRDHVLATSELRQGKPARAGFLAQRRNPITVVLDRVTGNYNIGAIFRLCDGFLVQELVICGVPVELHKRKLVRAAAGTHRWVPCREAPDAASALRLAKAAGCWIAAVELTEASVTPAAMQPRFPAVLVLGGETTGVSAEALALADAAIAIPMLGMANSLNVATATGIVLYELARHCGCPPGETPPLSAARERGSSP
jgi:tRNA G18 (ribose-2'-O)-methylase SpoU